MTTSRRRYALPLVVVLGLVASVSLTALPDSHSAIAAESPVGLGNAGSFAVLGATTITNAPTVINSANTTISGDLGVSPGSAVTGFPPGIVTNGAIHITDALAALAQKDLITAYDDAAGRTPTLSGLDSLDGKTLVPGVYSGGALSLNGTLTLNGTANDVFIFQATSTINAGTGSKVLLIGGASPCNVFWQVATSANIDTGAAFVGTVMALESISAKTGATVSGRLLARNGAVTLDSNVITRPTACALAAVGTPATPVPGRARFTG